ncbi:hypothetical protein Pst134EA_003323 [Puccinia striiformis f. sp. tritici]|uniref:hypothetical protein n=1 Tax=Puccinia striiformis f. sp. tritici TaxID=168172 RepID=UPI0020077DEB|nr:hypothetical protein Pst134EA_003323 [Puccinia striiformis f. sp. tritici]KAH9472716.1 hypothetical protein Pst134EA_003323 [Puccinia striiformis f. sp. tritici]
MAAAVHGRGNLSLTTSKRARWLLLIIGFSQIQPERDVAGKRLASNIYLSLVAGNLPLDGLGQIVLLSNNWKISSTTDNHKQLAKSNRHCLIHEISIGSQADNESNSALNWLLSLNRHRKGRSKAYLDSTVEHKLVWLEGATVANGLLVDVHIRTATSYQHNQFTPHLHQNLTWTPVTLFSFRLSTALVQLSAPPSQTPTASQSDKLYHQFCHTAARVQCAQVEGFSAGIGINHRLEDNSPPRSPTCTPLLKPTLNLTPAEPILTRPHLPRSASAIEPFLSSPSPGLQRRLTSSADHHHPRSSLPASERLTSVTRPPFLLRHHRTKSAEPSLAFISPLSKVISRRDSQSAQALLQRALEEDEDARSWVDDDDDYDLLDQDTLDVEIDNHPHDQLSHCPPTIIINQIPLSPGCKMDPVLADLEAKSRLNVQTECAICLKKGINYPKCPKCQLEFCSRTCRVSMGDGDRHECS